MARVAFLGIGLMGSPMAARLRMTGDELRVWNRTHSKAAAWAKDGGVACATPAEAARGADAVHVMLAHDDAVEEALFGDSGALSTLPPNGFVVDHSTVSVRGAHTRSERITARGWRFLQAPLMAGPAMVGRGEGLMYVGGPAAAFDAYKPALAKIVTQLWHVGERARDAAAFKLMANLLLVHAVDALAEFFALGSACGIEPERALALFDHYDPGTPIRVRAPRMARGDYSPAFTLAMAAKDVRLMIEAGRDGHVGLPALETIRERMLRMVRSGHGDLDIGALGYEVMHSKEFSPNAAGEG